MRASIADENWRDEKEDQVAKVPDTPENEKRCLCPGCPSYPGEGIFYCARGKSSLPVTRRGCLCGDCQNFKEYGLRDGYYCADGAAGEGPQ